MHQVIDFVEYISRCNMIISSQLLKYLVEVHFLLVDSLHIPDVHSTHFLKVLHFKVSSTETIVASEF